MRRPYAVTAANAADPRNVTPNAPAARRRSSSKEVQTMFRGSFTALITPFRDGEVDEAALRRLVETQVRSGTAGLVPCGTTGETPTLSEEEQDRVIAIVLEQAAGRVPVVAGTGGNDTARAIARTRRARELGAAAALVVAPYYNKPTQEGLFCHFAAIATAAELPIVLYNVPGRTGVNVTPETALRLAEVPGIVGIKEASGNLDQVSEIVAGAPDGFCVLSGDDSLTLPIVSVGGAGVISVVANLVPRAMADLTGAALAGDFARARAIHRRLFPLCRAMFLDNNPIAVKTAAGLLGLCSDEVRLPLTPMSTANRRLLEAALDACLEVGLVAA
jgi:4-hydroxy-tetrahydrodipicolinate synthase